MYIYICIYIYVYIYVYVYVYVSISTVNGVFKPTYIALCPTSDEAT